MKQKKMTLRQLSEKLKRAELNDDPLEGIVDALKSLSKWHNGDDFVEMFKAGNNNNSATLKKLKALQKCLEQTSFNKHGFNWTKPGKRVSDDKIFLGGKEYNLPLQSVAFWKKQNEEVSIYGKSSYNLVSYQARQIFKDYIVPMIKIIESIRRDEAMFIAM